MKNKELYLQCQNGLKIHTGFILFHRVFRKWETSKGMVNMCGFEFILKYENDFKIKNEPLNSSGMSRAWVDEGKTSQELSICEDCNYFIKNTCHLESGVTKYIRDTKDRFVESSWVFFPAELFSTVLSSVATWALLGHPHIYCFLLKNSHRVWTEGSLQRRPLSRSAASVGSATSCWGFFWLYPPQSSTIAISIPYIIKGQNTIINSH